MDFVIIDDELTTYYMEDEEEEEEDSKSNIFLLEDVEEKFEIEIEQHYVGSNNEFSTLSNIKTDLEVTEEKTELFRKENSILDENQSVEIDLKTKKRKRKTKTLIKSYSLRSRKNQIDQVIIDPKASDIKKLRSREVCVNQTKKRKLLKKVTKPAVFLENQQTNDGKEVEEVPDLESSLQHSCTNDLQNHNQETQSRTQSVLLNPLILCQQTKDQKGVEEVPEVESSPQHICTNDHYNHNQEIQSRTLSVNLNPLNLCQQTKDRKGVEEVPEVEASPQHICTNDHHNHNQEIKSKTTQTVLLNALNECNNKRRRYDNDKNDRKWRNRWQNYKNWNNTFDNRSNRRQNYTFPRHHNEQYLYNYSYFNSTHCPPVWTHETYSQNYLQNMSPMQLFYYNNFFNYTSFTNINLSTLNLFRN